MGEWGPTATIRPRAVWAWEPNRWGNGGQPQLIIRPREFCRSLTDGGMGANRNKPRPQQFACRSLTDGGMGANRNYSTAASTARSSLTDGGMGANRNLEPVTFSVTESLTDGGMGANRNRLPRHRQRARA